MKNCNFIDDRNYKGHHPYATNPYSHKDLKRFLRMPLKDKVIWATQLIAKELKECKNPVIAFSGGKSSEVMLHILMKVCRNVPVVYNDTGINEPGTTKFVKELSKKWGFELIITKPKKTFWEIVKEYGYPKMRSEMHDIPKCCRWLKEYPMRDIVKEKDFDCIFIGNQANENMNRTQVFLQYGEAYDTKKIYGKKIRKVYPVAIFTDYNLWDYIKQNNLPYLPIYDKMKERGLPLELQRTGCMFCTGYIGWQKKIRILYPKAFKKIMDDMKNENQMEII